jgi:hypothetical protein
MDRAAAAHLPTIYEFPEMAEEGGFAGYGPRGSKLWEAMVQQIVKIFHGTKVADIPVATRHRCKIPFSAGARSPSPSSASIRSSASRAAAASSSASLTSSRAARKRAVRSTRLGTVPQSPPARRVAREPPRRAAVASITPPPRAAPPRPSLVGWRAGTFGCGGPRAEFSPVRPSRDTC